MVASRVLYRLSTSKLGSKYPGPTRPKQPDTSTRTRKEKVRKNKVGCRKKQPMQKKHAGKGKAGRIAMPQRKISCDEEEIKSNGCRDEHTTGARQPAQGGVAELSSTNCSLEVMKNDMDRSASNVNWSGQTCNQSYCGQVPLVASPRFIPLSAPVLQCSQPGASMCLVAPWFLSWRPGGIYEACGPSIHYCADLAAPEPWLVGSSRCWSGWLVGLLSLLFSSVWRTARFSGIKSFNVWFGLVWSGCGEPYGPSGPDRLASRGNQ